MPEPGRSLVSYAHGSAQPDETLQALHALVHGIDVPPMSMEDMGVTDQAVIDHVASRVSPHPIKTMIQASKALPDWPDIPVTYVYASGTKVPTFEPFRRRLEADLRVDTHVVSSSHVLIRPKRDVRDPGECPDGEDDEAYRRSAPASRSIRRQRRRARRELMYDVVRLAIDEAKEWRFGAVAQQQRASR